MIRGRGVDDLDLGKVGELHDLSQELQDISQLSIDDERPRLAWNVAVIMACEATIAAAIATINEKISQPEGTQL